MPREFNLSPEAAVQCCESCTLRGFFGGKAVSKEFFVIQVTEAPISNNQEKVFPPAIAVNLGLIFVPIERRHSVKEFIARCD